MKIVTLLGVLPCALGDADSLSDKPNFVFMLADDWGWGDVGAYGTTPYVESGTAIQTPTLDSLAANGTLFTDFHTGQSFCAPSRATFMTGRFPADLHVNTNWNVGAKGAGPNHLVGLPYQLPTPSGEGPSPWKGGLPNVPYLMQKAGYATAHFGKWHLGGLSPIGQHTPRPSEYGFDMTGCYGCPTMANRSLVDSQNIVAGNTSDQWWSADVDDFTRDHGIAFMKKSHKEGKPFYLHLWWHMSHDRIDPRPEQLVDFPFKETCLFPSTAAGQTICPSQILWGSQTYSDKSRFAAVVDAVDELGIRANTYIVFSTDNGAQSHKWTNNKKGAFDNAVGTQGPFRGCKASLYDGGHRVPFIVTGPNVPKGRVDHSLLSAVDWLPTILSLSGNTATIPKGTLLRGADMSDVWHGKKNHQTERPEGKPLHWRGGGGPSPCWNRSPSLATRHGDWKLLINPDYGNTTVQAASKVPVRVELYNMSIGNLGRNGAFFESQNEADQHPDIVAALAKPLLEWHYSVGPKSAVRAHDDKNLVLGTRGCEAWKFPGLN